MNKYGKADEYRRSVVEGSRAMQAEMAMPKPPEPTCFCGGAAYLAVSRGGSHIVFCRAHEAEADAAFSKVHG